MKINNTLSKIKTTGAQSCSGHLQEDLLLSPQHHSHVNFRISRCGLTVEQNINADPSETNGQISDLKIRLCCSVLVNELQYIISMQDPLAPGCKLCFYWFNQDGAFSKVREAIRQVSHPWYTFWRSFYVHCSTNGQHRNKTIYPSSSVGVSNVKLSRDAT